MISVAKFRADFPEFSSSTTYPNAQVTYWLDVAYKLLNVSRWGNLLDTGAELFTAHNLALEARAQAEAKLGGVPGGTVGAINSKSVDKVSAGYDTSVSTEKDAGHWNLTIYGTRYYRLSRMMGAGPVQVGMGYTPPLNGPGWSGPDVMPGFTTFGS